MTVKGNCDRRNGGVHRGTPARYRGQGKGTRKGVQGPRERHPQGEHWAAQGQTQKAQGPWEELLGEKRWAAQRQTQQAQGPWEELLGEKR